MEQIPKPKVFISYGRKDEDWKNRLLKHLRALEQQGDIVLWDDSKIGAGEDWYPAIKKELDEAAVAICLVSANYLSSHFIMKEEIPALLERRQRDGMLLLPVLVSPCPWKTVQWLKGIQMFLWDEKSLAEIRGEVNQEKALAQIAEFVYEKINDPAFQVAAPTPVWEPPEKVDIDRLPQTGTQLFGRKKELELLDKAWQLEKTTMVSLVGWGGVGKSTLVNKWLELMRVENYRRAKRVFGWSFYSQGTKERVTSADKFISEALLWFGDPDPKEGSPWDKGKRLADLIRKQKTLLILDGLEPLQSKPEYGKIKDPALSMLVTQLARKNNGLCVITTREEVRELTQFDKGVEQPNLDQISKEAGRALLRVGGVQGTDTELEAASKEFGNHALAINLLASFLHDIKGHHISNAAQIEDLDIPEEEGRHPRRVIEAFEKRFGEGPEVQLLRILGLFDRPAEISAIEAVYSGAPIKGLTDKLVDLTEVQWQNLFEKLRGYKLLAKKSTHRPDIVDCHPLVREHFGEKLQKGKPKAWREAHGRLYEYYKNLPEKLYGEFLPDKLEKMEPLFVAVTHGCLAERHQETFHEVYWKRISRGNEGYSVHKLGAFGATLSSLSCFFEEPWSKPALGLTDEYKAAIFNFVGFALRALGRLTEAAQPMKGSLETRIKIRDWAEAARDAGNLSELYLTLGDVAKAVEYARRSMGYADRGQYLRAIFTKYSTLADALHQAGEPKEAKELFEKAEDMQKELQPEYPYLYSFRGFQFCDLLLSSGQYKEVLKRASETIQIAEQNKRLLDIALDELSLGRAYLIQALLERTSDYTKAEDFLNQTVDGLREAGTQHELPRGLLARAELYRYQRIWEGAWAGLEEAKEIAERGQMNLFLADYHLEAARLCLAEGNREAEAREHYNKAEALVGDMGYHRRDPEVLLIQAELELTEGKKEAAQETLKTAESRINEMGCHRWDIEVERLQQKL